MFISYSACVIDRFEDFKWDEIKTPIRVEELHKLLKLSGYEKTKTQKLINGFRQGFSIGYQGSKNRRDTADNLPLKELGTQTDLWNKVMKEVNLGRYSGPYREQELPFEYFIQSPISLVPKAGGQTRLIFHLSYNFRNRNKSVNAEMPDVICSVHYRDLDHAIKNCLSLLKEANELAETGMVGIIYFSKTDLKSAFRILPILVIDRAWLLMMAIDPETNEKFFFIEKCLPFRASISCALFQAFSDALHHITQFLIKKKNRITNYLDDFLFIVLLQLECNKFMQTFLDMCKQINCPVAEEKTELATTDIVFLGVLLNGILHCLSIPEDKRRKAVNRLQLMMSKKKAKIKEIQSLTGILNFFNRAIVPGRAFTRRMYAKLTTKNTLGKKLQQHHHVYLDQEFKKDCEVWLMF